MAGPCRVQSYNRTINIVLLGETGVGKSTWINGFINYLRHDSLDDALRRAPADDDLIPTSFSVYDKGGELRDVKYGLDSNEVPTAGESATQLPRTYTFNVGSQIKVDQTASMSF